MEYNGIFTYHTVNGDTKDLCVQLLKFLISVAEGGNLCKHQSCNLSDARTETHNNPIEPIGGPTGWSIWALAYPKIGQVHVKKNHSLSPLAH